jgi:hypothetical protein
VRFDDELRSAAEKLRPFGQKWIDDLGRSFFSLNEDRAYLPKILDRLISEARAESKQQDEEEWARRFRNTADGEIIMPESLAVLRRAEASGYTVETDSRNNTIMVGKGTSRSFLRSNYEIQRFGDYL